MSTTYEAGLTTAREMRLNKLHPDTVVPLIGAYFAEAKGLPDDDWAGGVNGGDGKIRTYSIVGQVITKEFLKMVADTINVSWKDMVSIHVDATGDCYVEVVVKDDAGVAVFDPGTQEYKTMKYMTSLNWDRTDEDE